MKNKENRRAEIIEMLHKQGPVSINELADRFDVSHMTVRRDVDHLLEVGYVRRYHGGVRLAEGEARTAYDLRTAEFEHREEKERIAMRAISLIERGDTLFLDGGTTTQLIAERLPNGYDLTVVSSALNIINLAAQTSGIDVIGTGGVYHESSGVFEGPEAVALLSRTRITKAFISANAVQFELGVTCSYHFEVAGKQAAMRSSLERILVVDSSKLGRVVSAHFADLSEFDRVIVDRPADTDMVRACLSGPVRFDFVDAASDSDDEPR